MRALVTGAAGFIGSTLVDALLARGDHVLGLDCFTPYYDRAVKEANLSTARRSDRFELAEVDVRACDLGPLLEGIDVVFHQAAEAGVRLSWSDGFVEYASHNVLATQRVLEAAKRAGGPKIVYASSSSVYGNAIVYPTTEVDLPRPHSPYGVTKLAAEHLCNLYAANSGLRTVSLRYFTVYGPRQRPDMAIHRLLEASLSGGTFPLYGDGSAVRDFTYVADVVAVNLAAADADCEPGIVLNVAGGSSVSMSGLLTMAAEVVGQAPVIEHLPEQAGDVARTGGAIDRTRKALGWEPSTDLRSGLIVQTEWHRARRG